MKCLGRGMVLFFETKEIDFVNHILSKKDTFLRRFHTGQWERLARDVWNMLTPEESMEYENSYNKWLKDVEVQATKETEVPKDDNP